MAECDICGREFDTERGVQVHRRQAHPDADQPDEDTGTEETTEHSASFGNLTLNLKVTHAVFAAFVIGIFAGGFFTASLFGAAGVTGMLADGPSTVDGGADDGSPSDTQDQQDAVDMSQISLEGQPVLGSSDAPVTMVIFEDFECPFCKRFERNTMPDIVSNYVETGKVKVVWKDLPLPQRIHPWADEGAEAMECVYRTGGNDAFWAVKDTVFSNQDSITESTVYDKVKQWASQEGVAPSDLQQCYDNGAMQEVQEDKADARSVGATGTPTVFVNGQKIVGAQPFSAFQSVIEAELS